MPAFQQGQWPNLAPRNTLFGGEELADIMLHGRLSDNIVTSAGRENAQLAAVLASKKSLLVALTRADERVTVSAVLNKDHVPSDFLYGYLPEWFDRDRDADAETRVYTAVGEAGEYAGLEADPRRPGRRRAKRAGPCADRFPPSARCRASLGVVGIAWHRRRESRQLGVPYGTCGSRRYDGNRRQDGI